jgi:iron complex outermembrane receptor protein
LIDNGQVNRYYSEVNRVYLEEVPESLTTNSLSYKNSIFRNVFGQVTDGEVDANGDGQIKVCCQKSDRKRTFNFRRQNNN